MFYPLFLAILNITSAVAIILLNKLLFRGWPYVLCLTALHAAFTQLGTYVLLLVGGGALPALPTWPVAKMALCGVLSVVLMNLNLSLNSLGIYQASKILIVPTTAVLERAWFGRRLSWQLHLTLQAVVVGVILSAPPGVIASLQSSRATLVGFCTAAASTAVASSAVILIGATQKQLTASPLALLNAQQPYVIAYATAMAFASEDLPGAITAAASSWHTSALILATGVLAVAVNASGFAVINLISPLSYQVSSHLKTILIIVLGVASFGEAMTALQALGFLLSVGGIAAYAAVKSQEQKTATSAPERKECSVFLALVPLSCLMLLQWGSAGLVEQHSQITFQLPFAPSSNASATSMLRREGGNFSAT